MHWVSLSEDPLYTDYAGVVGQDDFKKPRVKIAYEVTEGVPKASKKKKKSKWTSSYDEGEDDSRLKEDHIRMLDESDQSAF